MSCNVIAMQSALTTSFDAVKRRYVLPSKPQGSVISALF